MEIMTFSASCSTARVAGNAGGLNISFNTGTLSHFPSPFVLPRHSCYLSSWVRWTSFQVKSLLMQHLSRLDTFQCTQAINYTFTRNNHSWLNQLLWNLMHSDLCGYPWVTLVIIKLQNGKMVISGFQNVRFKIIEWTECEVKIIPVLGSYHYTSCPSGLTS